MELIPVGPRTTNMGIPLLGYLQLPLQKVRYASTDLSHFLTSMGIRYIFGVVVFVRK